jgi:hypothetical protein
MVSYRDGGLRDGGEKKKWVVRREREYWRMKAKRPVNVERGI